MLQCSAVHLQLLVVWLPPVHGLYKGLSGEIILFSSLMNTTATFFKSTPTSDGGRHHLETLEDDITLRLWKSTSSVIRPSKTRSGERSAFSTASTDTLNVSIVNGLFFILSIFMVKVIIIFIPVAIFISSHATNQCPDIFYGVICYNFINTRERQIILKSPQVLKGNYEKIHIALLAVIAITFS